MNRGEALGKAQIFNCEMIMKTKWNKFLPLLCLAFVPALAGVASTIYVAPYDPRQPTLIGTGTSADPYRYPSIAYEATANGDTLRFTPGLHYGKQVLNKRLRLEKTAGVGTAQIGGVNQSPQVDAGPDLVLTVGGTSWPAGQIRQVFPKLIFTDDALPPNVRYTTLWTKVSGPNTVIVEDMGIPTGWRITFSGPGSYVFRGTVSDGELSSSDDLAIEVKPSGQLAPVLLATSQPVTPPGSGILPAEYSLQASATLDGQAISPNRLTWYWYHSSGPGTVRFGNRQSPQTAAWFPVFGTYQVGVKVVLDGNASSAQVKTLTVVVSRGGNLPPVITGTAQLTLVLGEAYPLAPSEPVCKVLPFTVTDDGKPYGTLSSSWRVQLNRQNGLVTFANPAQPNSSVCFSRNGEYVLRLTASDGDLSTTNDLGVLVELPASRYLKFTDNGVIGGGQKMWVENTHKSWSITFRTTLFENPWTIPAPTPVPVAMTLAPGEKRELPAYDPHLVLKYCAYVSATQLALEASQTSVLSFESLSDLEPSMEPGCPILGLTDPNSNGGTSQPIQLQLYGDPNYEYTIEATTNFVNWSTIATTNGAPVGIEITDPGSRNQPSRFYRAVRR